MHMCTCNNYSTCVCLHLCSAIPLWLTRLHEIWHIWKIQLTVYYLWKTAAVWCLLMHGRRWFSWSPTAECSHINSIAVDFMKSACCCWFHLSVGVQQEVRCFVLTCVRTRLSNAWRSLEAGNIQLIRLIIVKMLLLEMLATINVGSCHYI